MTETKAPVDILRERLDRITELKREAEELAIVPHRATFADMKERVVNHNARLMEILAVEASINADFAPAVPPEPAKPVKTPRKPNAPKGAADKWIKANVNPATGYPLHLMTAAMVVKGTGCTASTANDALRRTRAAAAESIIARGQKEGDPFDPMTHSPEGAYPVFTRPAPLDSATEREGEIIDAEVPAP